MDDFGTGYSSLAELNNMHVSKLKIDKGFVVNNNNFSNNKIISAIIAIGKSLNIRVVAEGIKIKEQLTFLRDVNCDYGQGYLFSKPVDGNLFKKMMS